MLLDKYTKTDSNNPAGALVTGIAPSATTLAAYFCFSDLVLITQCFYYNTINARRTARERARSTTSVASEDEPLLRRRRTSSAGLPGSQRRPSVRNEESGLDPITRIVTGEDETPDSAPWLHNSLSLAAVYILGIAGWFASYKAGAWDGPGEPDSPAAASSVTAIVGMSLGYLSAVCYLCARVPQIIKNYREKSCEGTLQLQYRSSLGHHLTDHIGLALLFFLLSLTGNLTYGLSVFCYSQETDYIIKAIPWLLGSLGTMAEDCIIFYQFRIYDPSRLTKTNGTA